MHRGLKLNNNSVKDSNDHTNGSHSLRLRSLSRKISDKNSRNKQYHNQQSVSPYNKGLPSFGNTLNSKAVSTATNLNTANDTNRTVKTPANLVRKHPSNGNYYGFLSSPKLSIRQPSKSVTMVPVQGRFSLKVQPSKNTSFGKSQDDSNGDEYLKFGMDRYSRHTGFSRRIHQSSLSNDNHGAHATSSLPLLISGVSPTTSVTTQPLRIIFIRHSERANQALGSDWFSKAFASDRYAAYDPNLPIILPKRNFDQAYEFDVPLTGLIHRIIFCS